MISLQEFKQKIKNDETLKNKLKEKINKKIVLKKNDLEAVLRSVYETRPVYADEETADFIADAWAHGHSFFVYNSDSADALSSCCFDYNTPVTIKVEKDKTPVNGYIGSLYEQYHDKSIKTLSNGKWAKAKLIKLPNRPMLKITFLDENKWRKTVVVSDNHLHPTQRGDVETAKLTLNDKLKYAPDIYSKKYTFVDIVSIEPYKYSGDIYCFEMEDQTNPYFTLLNGLITHNCRLKNAIEENVFSYTLGAGGIQTGSKKVITLNLNRIVQDWFNKYKDKQTLNDYITTIVKRVHKYLTAWNHWLWDLYDADLLTVYKAGFISLDKQYLTVGVNGFIEGAEFLGLQDDNNPYKGITISPDNEMYKKYTNDILTTIKKVNIEERTEHTKFNTEMVPAENAGAKLYNWDKRDGYWVPEERNLYNSYFYPVENKAYDVLTKMKLHGNDFVGCLDGGSAYHCNLDEHLSKEQYRKLLDIAADVGCSYFTFNIPNTVCNDCGHIDKRYLHKCPKCDSTNVDFLTRVIGYLKRVSNFSEARQIEASHRAYIHNINDENR